MINGGKMIYKICDIHSHIVPAVDDGASNLNMSIEMLHMAYKQGTRDIICTSHNGSDIKKYYHNLKALQRAVEMENIGINLYVGCEVYCNVNIIEDIITGLKNKTIPAINGTRYVLVEFDPYESVNNIVYCVNKLLKHDYIPIIAHIERCLNLFTESAQILNLQNMGCLFQINAYSLQGETDMRIKTFARKLLKEKYITFIGSDSHRINHRTYMIKNGVDYIYRHCDIGYAKDICYRNAENILKIQ